MLAKTHELICTTTLITHKLNLSLKKQQVVSQQNHFKTATTECAFGILPEFSQTLKKFLQLVTACPQLIL